MSSQTSRSYLWGVLAPMLLLAALVPGSQALALDLPFLHTGPHLATDKPAYWRYEMVDFEADAPAPVSSAASAEQDLEVDIFKDGRLVVGLSGQTACLLRWDPIGNRWWGRWPVPWNPELGGYEARLAKPAPPGAGAVHVFFSGPGETRSTRVFPGSWLATCAFVLRGRIPAPLPKGFCAVTLEPGGNDALPAPDGYGRSPENAFAWARFMGADAFWHCALQTAWWPDQSVKNLPWDLRGLNTMRTYAAEAGREDTAYGAYMLTFLVLGDYLKTGYEFTLGYDATTDSLKPLRFISMEDSRRRAEIVAALRLLSSTPGVSYIGMDYVRANTGGLEFTDAFLKDFGLEVPPELREAPALQRRLWLGRHLTFDRDRHLHELWDWWRAHRVSLAVKAILDEAKVSRPVWVFSLGWKMGHQHGQDPRMLLDAGVSINAPMFYEANQTQFPAMLSDWRGYLGRTGGGLVVGECVDSRLLHPRPGFNGPQEHYQRQMEVLERLGPLLDRLGFFWHDLNRARNGGHGPEGMREWALAGASAFARLREAAGTVPMNLSITALVQATGSQSALSGSLRVLNLGTGRLGKVRVAGLWTPGLGDFQPRSWWLYDLAPGEARNLTFTVSMTPRFVRAAFRATAPIERMVAFRAQVPHDPAWPRPDIAFTYWYWKAPVTP